MSVKRCVYFRSNFYTHKKVEITDFYNLIYKTNLFISTSPIYSFNLTSSTETTVKRDLLLPIKYTLHKNREEPSFFQTGPSSGRQVVKRRPVLTKVYTLHLRSFSNLLPHLYFLGSPVNSRLLSTPSIKVH